MFLAFSFFLPLLTEWFFYSFFLIKKHLININVLYLHYKKLLKMEKLELKHLAPYLPYGIKGISKEEYSGVEKIKGLFLYGKDNTVYLSTDIGEVDLDMFKLILRPLSDITKEIEHNGKKFVPIDVISIYGKDISYLCEQISLGFVEVIVFNKLLEWHFDVFGLIEKGLAIDINTLNK